MISTKKMMQSTLTNTLVAEVLEADVVFMVSNLDAFVGILVHRSWNAFEDLRGDLRLRRRPGPRVLGLDLFTKARNPVSEHDSGKGLLDLGKLAQHLVTMRPPRAKTLGLRPGRRCGSVPSRAALPATIASLRPSLVPSSRLPGSAVAVPALAAATSTLAVAATGPAALTAAAIGAAPLADQVGGHAALVAARPEDLEHLGPLPLLLGRENGRDDNTVDTELGLGSHDIPDPRALVQETPVEVAFGLSGAGGPPGETPVVAPAGELHLEPS